MKSIVLLALLALSVARGSPLSGGREAHETPSPVNCEPTTPSRQEGEAKRDVSKFQSTVAIGEIAGSARRLAKREDDANPHSVHGDTVLRRITRQDDLDMDLSANDDDYADGGVKRRDVSSLPVAHSPFPGTSDTEDMHRARKDVSPDIRLLVGGYAAGAQYQIVVDQEEVTDAWTDGDFTTEKMMESTTSANGQSTTEADGESTTSTTAARVARQLPQGVLELQKPPLTSARTFGGYDEDVDGEPAPGRHNSEEQGSRRRRRCALGGTEGFSATAASPDTMSSGASSTTEANHYVNKRGDMDDTKGPATPTHPDGRRAERSPQYGGFDGYVLSDFSGYRFGRSVEEAPSLKGLNLGKIDQVILEELPRTSKRNKRSALEPELIQAPGEQVPPGDALPTMTYIVPLANTNPEAPGSSHAEEPVKVVQIYTVRENASDAPLQPAEVTTKSSVDDAPSPTFTAYVSVSSHPVAAPGASPVDVVTATYPEGIPPEQPVLAPGSVYPPTPRENVPASAPFVAMMPAEVAETPAQWGPPSEESVKETYPLSPALDVPAPAPFVVTVPTQSPPPPEEPVKETYPFSPALDVPAPAPFVVTVPTQSPPPPEEPVKETYPFSPALDVPAPAPFVVTVPTQSPPPSEELAKETFPLTPAQDAPAPFEPSPQRTPENVMSPEGGVPEESYRTPGRPRGLQILNPPPAGSWAQAPSQQGAPVLVPGGLIEKTIQLNPDGSFVYSFETADGTKVAEVGMLRELPPPPPRPSDPYESVSGGAAAPPGAPPGAPPAAPPAAPAQPRLANTVMGGYSYTAPDGTFVSLRYVADENGFRTVGEALPYSRVGSHVADRFGQ